MSVQPYPGTERTHLPGGEITASEQHRRHQDWLDQVESTVLCAFCPGWSFTGPAVEARAAALLHRTEEHPTIGSARRRTVKRDCKVPGCAKRCKPGSDRCWDHADQAAVKETAGVVRPAEAAVSSTADGLDLLERMDAGLPLNDGPVLGEVARVGESAVTGSADLLTGDPVHSDASPNTDERTSMECKVDGCTKDASDAPKAGPTARLCSDHRAIRSAEISAARTGKTRRKKTTARAIRAAGGGNVSRRRRVKVEIIGRGPTTAKAERLLAAARNVDEAEKVLEQARAQLKQAVDELAA